MISSYPPFFSPFPQGFLVRVIPAHPHINLPLREETILLMQRASLYFTVGLRLLYGFVPLAFYMATGPLAMLISTVLLLISLILLDTVPARQVDNLLRVSTVTSMDLLRQQEPVEEQPSKWKLLGGHWP